MPMLQPFDQTSIYLFSERYRVDEAMLASIIEWLGGELSDPLNHGGPKPTIHDHKGHTDEIALRDADRFHREFLGGTQRRVTRGAL